MIFYLNILPSTLYFVESYRNIFVHRAKSELRHPKKRPAGPVLVPKFQSNPKFVVPYPSKGAVYEDVVLPLPPKVYVHDN